MLAGGLDSLPPGGEDNQGGGKISWDSLPPRAQAVQGGKINCYTGTGVWSISSVACGFSFIKIDYSDYPKSLISRINKVKHKLH